MRISTVSLLLLLLVATASVRAQQKEPDDNYRIFVLTMQAGDAVWEKFGHNAIWIHDEAGQTDLAYNWGLFDFSDANFFSNFAKGLMLYNVGESDLDRSLAEYQINNRTIWAQELNLTPEQKRRLVEKLAINVLPENDQYLYNYYTDNCSTRVRDAIDDVVGGQIKRQLEKDLTSRTWRWHTRRLTQDSPLWYTLLNTAMGPATDAPLTPWEECFLPLHLRDNLAKVTLTDESGNERPLIRDERTLFQSTRPPAPEAPPNWVVRYGAIGLSIAAVNLLLLHWALRRRGGRVAMGAYIVLYGLIIGICGGVGIWFWTVTDHWGAYRNENLFAYSPLGLGLALIGPTLFFGNNRFRRAVVVIALAVAGLSVIGVLIQALPGFDQVNGEPLALILPPNVALAWSIWFYNRQRRKQNQPYRRDTEVQ